MRKFLLLFISIAFLISCKKSDNLEFDVNDNSTNSSDYKFLNNSLKEFANGFVPVLSNKDARNIIREKAKLKFDEEYEVLIKHLFEDPVIKSLVSSSISEKLHNDLFKRSGSHIYPQIYIPRFQYLEDNGVMSRIVTEETPPVFVFYSGDPEVDSAQNNEEYPGYILINGEFHYYTMVDEDYANANEVWVLSLNETVNEEGRVPVSCAENPCEIGCPPIPDCDDGGGGGGGGGNPDDDPTEYPTTRNPFPDFGHNKINFKIQLMRVRTHNESWLAGASEISIRAKLVCHNGRHLGLPGSYQEEYTSDQYSNYLGKLVKKVKRKDINDQELLTVDYPLQTDWQNEVPNEDPVHFIYVLFERDIFPATLNGAPSNTRYAPVSLITGEQPPGGFPLFYRSSDKNGNNWPYARYLFTNTLWLATANTYAGTGLVENPDIAFNTVIY